MAFRETHTRQWEPENHGLWMGWPHVNSDSFVMAFSGKVLGPFFTFQATTDVSISISINYGSVNVELTY